MVCGTGFVKELSAVNVAATFRSPDLKTVDENGGWADVAATFRSPNPKTVGENGGWADVAATQPCRVAMLLMPRVAG
jgi:hypothetical protein